MQLTTSTVLRDRRLIFLALLGALLLLTLALAVPALAARPDYTGGPAASDYPLYVPNDYTVSALRFTADAGTLYDTSNSVVSTSGVQYYVKVRLTPNADGSPAGVDNRGFTWNPTTQKWVQEREDWANFPIVTTGSGGAITPGSTWYYFRFGDTTKAGTYRVLVSLQPVGGGSGMTQNNAAAPAVTVLDVTGTITGATGGFVVHDGAPTAYPNKRIEVDEGGSSIPYPVWGLSRIADPTVTDIPGQLAPDLWTGANAASGDLALGVPVGLAFDVRINTGGATKAIWPTGASSFTGTLPDVNLALDQTDHTAPNAPGALTVAAGDGTTALTWGAATDDTSVEHYIVYRWTDAPTGAGYSAMPTAVYTTTTGSQTTWTDTGLANGTTYNYLVRAEDGATNIGPRSTSAAATPLAVTALKLSAIPTTVSWGKPWSLSGSLVTATGASVADAQVKLMKSTDRGSSWTFVSTLTPAAGTSTYAASIAAPTRKTMYRLIFAGDTADAAATSSSVTVTPKVKLGKPSARKSVTKKKSFSVSGSLTPKAKAGSKTVQIKCYQKKSGKWVLKKRVMAKSSTKGSKSVYKVKTSLPAKGSWKLVAYAKATSKYAATTSGAFYVKAK